MATYGFLLRLIFQIDTWEQRFPVQTKVHIIDKQKVEQLKRELHDPKISQSTYLSTNDIIMAAIARHLENRIDILQYIVDSRGKVDGVETWYAGNLEKNIYISSKDARDPNRVRQSTKKLTNLEKGIPFVSMFRGRYGTVSNWTSLTQFLPLDILCHTPPLSFVNCCPIPLAVVFKADRETTAVLRNHCKPSKDWKKKKSDFIQGDDELLSDITLL